MNLNSLTIIQALEGLRAKKFTSVDITQACLDQIEKLNPKINAFLTVNKNALIEANNADINKPLGGIPIAIKDNFLTKDLETMASSKVLQGFIPPYESTVTQRLKAAGAIILGKTNMDAWAHGSSTETSDFGVTKNPWHQGFLPGGSSGGSAAAVASDMCLAAIGSETAGSIRQPSSWCGVTGFKPTYGRVSRYGVIAMASSTDSPGPITKTVEDSALILSIIAGLDPYDATSSPQPVSDYLTNCRVSKKKLSIAFPKEYLEVLDPSVRPYIFSALEIIKNLGHSVDEISLLHPKYSIGVYTILQRSEVSSNLARYDGIRYGQNRTFFGSEAKRRIMLGTYALSSGYYDQYYAKAQKVRTLIVNDFAKAFQKYDLIIDPASPSIALKIGSTDNQSMFGEMQDVLVEPSSIAGLTGISIPCGLSNGLPVGFGFVGPQFAEDNVLSLSYQFQQSTDFHLQKPKLNHLINAMK